MASLDDLFIAAKNIVTALANATQTYLVINGAQVKANISTTTIVSTAAGRFVTLSIVTGGSAAGTVYDASTAADTTTPLYTIPTAIGLVYVNLPVTKGIVVVPGTGQVVTVGYS